MTEGIDEAMASPITSPVDILSLLPKYQTLLYKKRPGRPSAYLFQGLQSSSTIQWKYRIMQTSSA